MQNKPSTGKRASVRPANANTPASAQVRKDRANVLILCRHTRRGDMPPFEAGPAAFLQTCASDAVYNPHFWFAMAIQIAALRTVSYEDFIIGLGHRRTHLAAPYSIAGYANDLNYFESLKFMEKAMASLVEIERVKYGDTDDGTLLKILDIVEWNTATKDNIGKRLNEALEYHPSQIIIPFPEIYKPDGQTMGKFATDLLGAFFGYGAFYDYSEGSAYDKMMARGKTRKQKSTLVC